LEQKLTGGHHNSLGNTVLVVDEVLKDTSKLEELYRCYFSEDELVRLRTSSAWKRIAKHDINLFIPYIDRFLDEISKINQASTQWTIAILLEYSTDYLTDEQKQKAKEVMKSNLKNSNDWIVLKNTMTTLSAWAKEDEELKQWMLPELERLKKYPKKVVPQSAEKIFKLLEG
jgi:hypothetical protein